MSFEDELRYIGVKYNIDSIGIFGSRARGDFREDSDYDIFIIGEISLSDELKLEEAVNYEVLEIAAKIYHEAYVQALIDHDDIIG